MVKYTDKKELLNLLEKDAYELKYASDILKNDKEVVLKAVKRNGDVLYYTSDELKNDCEANENNVVVFDSEANGSKFICD